ncbi:MAG: tRNA (adenosine(37)-N6)-dimethylallyltransferase MiaA [Candidatus Nealsonbacteria bacterium CG02_land_8_20_14_3_00_37_10]|uniref:tRNA dimethylallyltransferase n=1 Tax=Candidatus Nealsonbacteria bacterium CG02_land_8_20_14_3_00_37_10 TaxID=1974699 RepID=A0A2M7D9K7_9BACT|nr:MAG: tRNA (adenosine(37)-N6)-dimethylallyltransferase MiaA [Candidatus Nealsonbacteria bacterium CG02_land_8_20_14_3_00_37_10]
MKYFIITFGCQMNKSDSERIAASLEKKGYKAASNINEADLIVINMCSVRQSAVDRIYGKIKDFTRLKKENPKLKIILTGCILKKDKEKFKETFDEIWSNRNYINILPKCQTASVAYIPISNGCNNFCTYCVVPFTRGPLVCRNHKEIIKEVKNAVKEGVKEIWLLGQNVNDYNSTTKKSINFPKLLKMINDIPGDFRLKFTSPNPKNFSDELINIMAESEKIAHYLNLPVQSGDNEILKRMNRPYTVQQYKTLVKKIREKIPDIFLSTDIIVGFPGESKPQFENTVKLFKEINFDMAYISEFSPRPETAAAKMKDTVPHREKEKRWRILNQFIVKNIKERRNNEKKKLIVILGPTASGKSELAVKLAEKFNGEVISADSRQVYKGMDIGTGKITKKEMRGIPHYLLDIASPKRRFSVVQYKKLALKSINKIFKKGKIPILCGGTGFYIQAVVDGIIIPEVKPDWKLRKQLELIATEELFKKLKKLDPQRAKTIDRNNRRRLIRALEVVIKTKRPVPALKKNPLPYPVLMIGIKKEKEELKKLIKKRFFKWLKQGLIKEVKKLKKLGLSWKKIEDFGIHYRVIAQYLQDKINYKKMIENSLKELQNYAKRQMTWFKKDKRICWVKNHKEAEKLVKKFLK